MLLYIFRHGQTEANVTGLIQGNVDLYGLNEVGRMEAERLGQELATAKLPVIYASPLSRAKETAEYVASSNGAAIKIVEGLHEVDMGKADGMYEDDAIEKFGDEIFSLANENNVTVLYEAAVAGGIPIIGPIKTTLKGNEFNKVMGILNGTTNYILTKMEEDGVSYLECLKDAQKLGYAEADPTNDVEGYDTMFKIAILSNIVFHKKIDYKKIYREGITKITQDDIKCAKELGYKIKLIGLAQKLENDELDIRVHPVLVEENSMLAKISNAINTVQLEGSPVGSVMFTGPGAGEGPTASSVVGDILAIAAEISYTDTILPSTRVKTDIQAKQADILNTKNSYFLAINAQNARGTIGIIGSVCAENNINLQSILQKGIKEDNTALIVVITEASYEADIQNAVKKLNEQNIKVTNLIRVI